eukprot:6761179-Pyramimonas_sp.AAC.1
MRRWHSSPERLARRRRGILRVGPACAREVRGRRCVFKSKLRRHYSRLLKSRHLCGLLAWQECAEGLRAAGVGPRSGAVSVE